jgi:hypothetical protein
MRYGREERREKRKTQDSLNGVSETRREDRRCECRREKREERT